MKELIYKQVIQKQEQLIYQLSKQPNAIGKEWRERVEGLEIEIKELSSELAQLKAEAEKEVSDEDIEKWAKELCYNKNENPKEDTSLVKLRYLSLIEGASWFKSQLKQE